MTGDDTRYHGNMLITAARPLKTSTPSRYKRLSLPDQAPPGFPVTDRVIAILFALAEHWFLSTDQIVRLDGGSPAYVRHLLCLLHRNKLVTRPAGHAAYLLRR